MASEGRAHPRWQAHRFAWAAALALAIGAQLVPAVAARGPSGPAFVRINQLGYVATAPKRAYLMSATAESGGTFTVRDSQGESVLRGRIGRNLGAWSASFPFVYAIDFDQLRIEGNYRIVVSGPPSTVSPDFRVDTGAAIYSGALANALSFYHNERDGPAYIATALRTAPGHLNDVAAMTYLPPTLDSNDNLVGDLVPLRTTIDASGAWFDAGDYLKFVETASYVVGVLLLGVKEAPAGVVSHGRRVDFAAEAKFGLDWLSRMWDDRSRTLYYQVGIGTGNDTTLSDHDIWRLPQADDTWGGTDPQSRFIRNRPVFRAGPAGSKISPNLAGRLAADFGLCYQVFLRSDPARARQCLLAGEHVFDLADTAPTADLLTASPHSFYPETEWVDDLEWGAAELHSALAASEPPRGLPHSDPGFYLKRAAHWAHAYIAESHPNPDAPNLYDVSGLAHYELYQAIDRQDDPAGLEVTRAGLLGNLKDQLDRGLLQAGGDPFGFGFPWATFDTATHGAGLSLLAAAYGRLSGRATYAAYADRWLGNVLGANAWGSSFIVGDGQTFPQCMQHQVANVAGSLDGSAPILAGALVEGPNSFAASGTLDGMRPCPAGGGDRFAHFNGQGAVFQDNVESYSTVEPAIDLVAGSTLAFAWLAGS